MHHLGFPLVLKNNFPLYVEGVGLSNSWDKSIFFQIDK